MNDIDRHIQLSAIHVRWSAPDTTYIAHSDQYPTLTYQHECSLAALNGLIDTIHRQLLTQPTNKFRDRGKWNSA